MSVLRRLREHEWFWPLAFWLGLGFIGRMFSHPLWNVLMAAAFFATLFGVTLAIPTLGLSSGIGFIVLAVVVAATKGARLKWKADRWTQSSATTLIEECCPTQICRSAESGLLVELRRDLFQSPHVICDPGDHRRQAALGQNSDDVPNHLHRTVNR